MTAFLKNNIRFRNSGIWQCMIKSWFKSLGSASVLIKDKHKDRKTSCYFFYKAWSIYFKYPIKISSNNSLCVYSIYTKGGGLWAVYYTSPQSFLIYWFNNFEDFNWILIGWFIKLGVQIFQPLTAIYTNDIFVYHHRGWTSTYLLRYISFPEY